MNPSDPPDPELEPTPSAPTGVPSPDSSLPVDAILERLPNRDRHQARVLFLKVSARMIGYTAAILLGYAVLPVSADGTTGGLLVLFAGIAVLVAVIVRQMQKILNDEHPILKGVEAVAIILPLFIVVFSYTYVWMSTDDPGNFSQTLGRLDAVYFVITVLTTVGFGDITAISQGARAVVSLQMILDLILIVGVAKLLVGVTQIGARRRSIRGTSEPTPGDGNRPEDTG